MRKEMVHHPDHYQGVGGLEVWEVQKAFTAGLTGVIAGDACAIIKYACRWPKKNGVEDLKKIIEYCQHLIKELEEECPAPMTLSESDEVRYLGTVLNGVTFGSASMADAVMQDIRNQLTDCGFVSIQDVLDISTLSNSVGYVRYANDYGWTDLSIMFADADNSGRMKIYFPPIEKLNKEKESN